MNEIYTNTITILQMFSGETNKIMKNIDWDALRHTVQILADILASIPKEVKDTEFFQKVETLNKKDITYENIDWFIENIRIEVLIEKRDSANWIEPDSRESDQTNDVHANLTKYVESVRNNSNLSVSEKMIILLAHMEPFIFETLHHEKAPKENLRKKVKEITIDNNKGMSAESLAKVHVYGIHSIIYAGTDFFEGNIDKRLPFRNNILHNGILDYADEDISVAYEVLSDFIDALVILKHWIPSEGK